MKIFLNGEVHETEATTVDQLCISLGFTDAKVATALNGEFVPRGERASAVLKDNDKIEILSPRQGG